MSDLRTVAVVLAGGVGTRFDHAKPKQLVEVAGRTILAHSIAAFEASPLVDDIIVVMAPGHIDAARSVVDSARFAKVSAVIEGGATRTDSTSRALEALGSAECHVLLHDAARPAVSEQVIAAVVTALSTHDAVGPAVESTDTTVLVTDEVMVEVLPRDRLRRMQTPQGFRLSVIRAATLAAADDDQTATDDCTAVLRHVPGVEVLIVAGDPDNIKVTTQADLEVAERLLTR
ncbi:MAG: 2-C-methyl-D-erythritol 4-phosphate cytidylyltransferase [Aeromicrobium sp.]|nr:2-C-methyl-D-erythritol 4-phosphate cytidylyltransferase [Aeromicrobium sp.]